MAAVLPNAYGALINPCSSGVANENVFPVKTAGLTYCVTDFGWSDTYFKGSVNSYDHSQNLLAGDEAFNIRWDGSGGHGYLSPSLDAGAGFPQDVNTLFGSASQWSVSTALHYTSPAENETQSVIVHPNGLEVTITTTGAGSTLAIRFDFHNSGQTTLTNLLLSDFFNFHPHGSAGGSPLLGTTAYYASCPPAIGACNGAILTAGQPGQPGFLSNGYLYGQSAPAFWGVGHASGVASGQELWNQLAQGIFNGLVGPAGPGDTAGLLGWNLGTLDAGDSTSFTIYKGLYDPVPEPGTWLLVLAGAALVLVGKRRRAV